jgi:uncharacterized protein (DUF58 family)
VTVRPTRRGYATLAVAAVAVLLAAQAGARSLNAVAAPALLVVAYGWVTLRRRREPTVTRRKPAPGFPGETREVALRVDAAGPTRVTDAVGDGLAYVADTGDEYGPGEDGYRIELTDRGARTLGPATVRETDAFGLLARRTETAGETEVLVYPAVEPVAPNRTFRGLVEQAGSPDRDAFDSLREYVPGDALRDVHWKSSAKRAPGDLVVARFATEDEGAVTVAAAADPGHADAMASAAASIAVYLLDADLGVEVVAPNGRTERGRGDDARDELLELLARTSDGGVDANVEADVRVVAGADGVTVTTQGRSFPFEDLLGDTGVEDARTEVAAA